MSTDLVKDKPVHQNRTLAEVNASAGIRASAGATISTEIEISDETLEAVAGGGVANPDSEHTLIDQG